MDAIGSMQPITDDRCVCIHCGRVFVLDGDLAAFAASMLLHVVDDHPAIDLPECLQGSDLVMRARAELQRRALN